MFYQPLSLCETAYRLRSGDLDLLEFVNALCDRIDEVEPHVRSLISENKIRDRLLCEAEILLKSFPDENNRPLLFGIPVGVKDIFRADGFETRCGSSLPAELFAGKEASCVSKLRNAGTLILGKTVTTEFAYFEPGPTGNPHNIEHTPGGSSSGSAAAVAAGLTPLALGTQTIGSVIRPAAYCGVVGFKPSYGKIAADGVIPFSHSADQLGFFTQNISDCNMAASVLCDNWKENIFSQRGKTPLVIGIPEGKYLSQTSDDILEHFENTLQKITGREIIVKRIKLFDDIENINKAHRVMVAAEMTKIHDAWYERYMHLYRERTIQIIEEGLEISTPQLEAAKQGRFVIRKEIESIKEKEGIDLWASPATLTLPPKGLSSTGSPLMNLPWTYAGLPVITLPFGKINGFPVGIQFCGSFNEDEVLLNLVDRLAKII